jgi:hypothetical protein
MARLINVAILLFAATGLGTAAAEDHGLLDRCWTPQALAGTQAELKALHAHAKLDLTALRQEKLPDLSPVPPELRGSISASSFPSARSWSR